MSLNKFIAGFLLLVVAKCSYAQQENLFFRKDYTYLNSTQNFYKIYTLGKNFKDSINTCESEGASLFYPHDEYEANAVIEFWSRTQKPIDYVGIGVAAFIAEGVFQTIDGKPLSEVYDKWAPGEPNNADPAGENCVELKQTGGLNDVVCDRTRAFICVKSLESLDWNYDCNIPNTDYKLESPGKCYKFSLTPKSWTDAYTACAAEQSYLAIINSQEEADILTKITDEADKDSVEGDYLRGAVHLGFRKGPIGWVTIRGQRLQDSGYSKWGYGQPDNAGGNEVCGSMFYNGHLNDINCPTKLFYICEHDVKY